MKSISKPKSITTDTRLSNSHVLNRSSLNNTQIQQAFEPKENFFSHKIKESENRQVQFIRHKNKQLEQRVQRMTEEIESMEQNKKDLLELNRKYVNVVNRYYENCNKKIEKRKSYEGKVLQGLEKDHRNLVNHCLVMEGQIKNYVQEMDKFDEQKRQLREGNHTSVAQMLDELMDLTNENKELKKQNNKLSFELEKSKMENQGMRRAHQQMEQQAGNSGHEVQKMKSILNTIKQQSQDKAHAYEARIYEMQVKVEKLQTQLRRQQEFCYKENKNKRNLQMKEVEYVHEKSILEKSLADLLNPKVHKKIHMNRTLSTMSKRNKKNRKSILDKTFDIS